MLESGRSWRWRAARSRSLGVPAGGAADRAALALGNALVGNPPLAGGLEFALAGPTVARASHRSCRFRAPFTISVNEKPIAAGTTFTLEAGDELRIGGTATGVRGYLCVAGGFQAPEIMGSRSSLEPMQANRLLECLASSCEPRARLRHASLFDTQSAASSMGRSATGFRTIDFLRKTIAFCRPGTGWGCASLVNHW